MMDSEDIMAAIFFGVMVFIIFYALLGTLATQGSF